MAIDLKTDALIEDARAVLTYARNDASPYPETVMRFALNLPFLEKQEYSTDDETGAIVAHAIMRMKDEAVFGSAFWRQVAKAAAEPRENPDFQIAVVSVNSGEKPLSLVRLSTNVPRMPGVIVERLLDLEDTAEFCSTLLDVISQNHQDLMESARVLGFYEQAIEAMKILKEKAQALEIPPLIDQS